MKDSYFSVDTSTGQFILEHHDDDTEHADNEGVVADPFPLLKKRFPPTQSVAHVGLTLPARRGRGRHRPAATSTTAASAAAATTAAGGGSAAATTTGAHAADTGVIGRRFVFGVARVFRVDADQRRRGLLVADVIILATGSFHGRGYGQCGYRFPQLQTQLHCINRLIWKKKKKSTSIHSRIK